MCQAPLSLNGRLWDTWIVAKIRGSMRDLKRWQVKWRAWRLLRSASLVISRRSSVGRLVRLGADILLAKIETKCWI